MVVCDAPDEIVVLSNSLIEISFEQNSEVHQAKDMQLGTLRKNSLG